MVTQNLHAHCTFDDGQNTPEEMVIASLQAGLCSVGLSLHSPMPFEATWAAHARDVPDFLRCIRALREQYAGKIRVYAGVEWDVLASPLDLTVFDYVIGSVHYLPVGKRYPTVDDNEQTTQRFLAEAFGGDADAAAVMYFGQVERLADEPEVDVVGHFDLITKFDERRRFFNPDSSAYRRAALRAMEALAAAGKIFEINTGAISRGYRTAPYPSKALLCALARMGGRVTVSADAHGTAGVACAFEQAQTLAQACGFREVWQLMPCGEGQAFIPMPW